MPRIHSIASRQRLKGAWVPALLLIIVTQAFAAGLDWSPYPEDNNKDAQKAKAAEIRAKTAEQRAADLEQRLKVAEEKAQAAERTKAAKAIQPVVPTRPDTSAPPATPSIATTAPAVLAPLSVFRDKLKSGEEGPAMVVIPAGSFEMGANDGNKAEKPAHPVKISKSFAIGRMEISHLEWRQVMGEDHHRRYQACNECAITSISWNEAQTYVTKLSQLTGKDYRLPSEAEWEYACRGAQSGEKYCGGNDADLVSNWLIGLSGGSDAMRGKKQPNGFGLYDMSGNAREWVEDVWHESYIGAPSDGSVWNDSGDKNWRVIRSSSWARTHELSVRSSVRFGDEVEIGRDYYGFRVARSLP